MSNYLKKLTSGEMFQKFGQKRSDKKNEKHTQLVKMTHCCTSSPGEIHLIVGPMFSGKTTELFRLCNRFSLAKRKVIVVKYARDTRYSSRFLSTHDKRQMDAVPALHLTKLLPQLEAHDVIGIDEGQFFDDVSAVAERLANLGKIVVISALNSDYKREAFSEISKLVGLADKVEKLNAVCRLCGENDAPFTLRTFASDEREVIGGENMYQAACRICYHAFNKSGVTLPAKEEIVAEDNKEITPEQNESTDGSLNEEEIAPVNKVESVASLPVKEESVASLPVKEGVVVQENNEVTLHHFKSVANLSIEREVPHIDRNGNLQHYDLAVILPDDNGSIQTDSSGSQSVESLSLEQPPKSSPSPIH